MTSTYQTTLRPGVLVGLRTSLTGNVSYQKRELEKDHVTRAGERKAKWETERTITDPEEHEEATRVRGRATGLVRSVCARTDFGLLCPNVLVPELNKALDEARQLARTFNAKAKTTKLELFVIKGNIEQDDVEAARAVNSEVRDLLASMEEGLQNLDVKVVREAASRANNIGSMLTPAARERIKVAVDTARAAARKIVKAGEAAALDIDEASIRKITEARGAFLDLDPGTELGEATVEARALDLAPADDELTPAQKAVLTRKNRAAALELE